MAKRKNALEEAQALFGRVSQGASNLIQGFNKPNTARGIGQPTPDFKPYQQILNNPIVRNVGNFITKQPLLNNTLGFNPTKSLSFSPSIGQYGQGQVIKPIQTLLNRRESLPNRVLGGVQAGFSVTPTGALFNVAGGGIAGALKSIRTGAPIQQSIRTGMAQPTGIASQGLGLQGIPAIVGDIALGSPKSALQGIGKVKGAVQGIKGIRNISIHPEDIQDAKSAIDMLKYTKSATTEDKRYALKTIQNILERYAPGYKNVNNKKAIQTIENLIYKNEGESSSFPKMGIIGGKPNSQELKKSLTQPLPEQGQGGVPPLPQKPQTEGISKSFNTGNYNIPTQAKAKITQTVDEIRPEIEKAVGAKLTNEEAVNFAKRTNQILDRTVGRDQTLAWEASLLKARQKLADASKNGTIDQDYLDTLLSIKTQGTDIARKLQSFGIGADPISATVKDKILEAVLKVNQNTDEILKYAKTGNNGGPFDFNDYNQAVNFYRKFIKPSAKEYVDLVRYNSMLSSPITHIVNAVSNLINTGVVAPVEKTLTGTIDFLNPVRRIKGQPQTQFAGEGAAYSAGFIKSIGEASHKFANVLKGKVGSENLDIDFIPVGTDRRTVALSLPTRLLEATDQLFTTLARGGETAALKVRQGKGLRVGNVETEALRKAKYRVFRGELFDKDQGVLLNGIDEITQKILSVRNSKNPLVNTLANFTLPFVKTPMNILKQGVEYSPAGFGTIPGAKNKTAQLSKAILGTAGAAAAATLIASGRTTWAEPTDPNGRARFRAAGLQPYAIKVGDNWVSFQKLPPSLSFPLALMAGLHDALRNKTIDQSTVDVALGAFSKLSNFYTDQSYLKNIGDLVSAAKGSTEQKTQFFGNYPQQVIPFRALLGWMARLTDPLQRKVNTDAGYIEQQVQNLLKEIPFASRSVPARIDDSGEPIPNQNRFQNAFSPFRITTERPEQKELYDIKRKESLFKKNIKAAELMIQQGKKVDFGDIASAEEQATITYEEGPADLQKEMLDKVNKQKAKLSGNVIEDQGRIYYMKGGSPRVIDLKTKLEEPTFSGNPELDKRALSDFSREVNKKKNEVEDLISIGKLTPEQGETLLQGLTQKLDNIKSSQKAQVSYELTGDPVIDKAIIARQKGALTAQINEIVDYVQEGKLTAEQGRSLIDRLKAKNSRIRVGSGGGGRRKKVNYKGVKTTAKPIKMQALKIKLPKTRIPKYKPIKPLKIRRVYAGRT